MVTGAAIGAIERTDLTARILEALDAGSLLVIADAGFGKTTALRQALDEARARRRLRDAWVRCGSAAGDPGLLLGLVVDAVRAALPGAADVLAERLARAREPIEPERATAALERELASVLVDPMVIVFDDGEVLDGVSGALGVLARLITSDSPLLRVAIASRRRLALRVARERVAGRVTELGPPELTFSASEIAHYLRMATGTEPADEDVEAVLASTEGWPLGVALAAGAGDRTRQAPSRGLAHDYFDEEVVAALEPPLRDAVLAAGMAPDLEIAQSAGLGAADALDLTRPGLLARGDSESGRREFHPLFREFLRSRFLAQARPDEKRAVARAIGNALVAAGRGPESVEYFLAAEDWDAAAAAIAREGPALIRSGSDTVSGWLAALPPASADRPELTLLSGQLAHGQGRFAIAVELCRQAVARLDRGGSPARERFAARFALGDALMAVGELDSVASLGDVLDDPASVGDLGARAVGVFAAAAMARQGRFEAGRTLFDRALDDPCAAVLDGLAPAFAGYYLELPAGRLDDAIVHGRRAVKMLENADPTARLPYALTYLMEIHEERGEDQQALEVALGTRARARETGLAGWVGEAIAIRIASLLARAGDIGGAEARLAEVAPGWQAWGAWEMDATRATIAARRGDGHEARAAAERAVREVDARWPYFDRARCTALLAPTLADAGHPGRARELVESAIAARPPGFSTARLHAVLAWLRHDEGDVEAAIAALSAAWRQAGDQAQHLIRREWPRLERPIWEALAGEAIDVQATIDALAAALAGGAALAGFTRHPVAAVRRAALLASLAAGRPEGIEGASELQHDPDPGVRATAHTASERMRREPPPLAFRLLGGFEVRRGAWVVDDAVWERRVAQRLVRFLLAHECGPVVEDDLVEAFWPDRAAAAAHRSLQVAVSAARGVLDLPGTTDSRLICAERTYRLGLRDGDAVDAFAFERAAAVALASDEPHRRAALGAAAAMWAGEPLPEERYSDWATAWRERLIDRHAQLLSALADTHVAAGDFGAAVEVGRRLVELDPLDEYAHQRLIIAFALAGRRGHALRQFLACRRALVTSLGVEPSAETTALQRRLLAGAPIYPQ